MKKRPNFLVVLLVFLLINFIFNFRLWRELFSKQVTVSDNIITEYLVETSYQNILHFKNPFITKSIFYPFTTNFSMNDSSSAYVLPFFFLRPFFDPHKSILIITLLGFLLNNIIMYILLRKLKIRQGLSMIIALVFGFTPFLSHRIMGHYTYIPIFFFPLVFLVLKKLLETTKTKEKYIISLLLGLLTAITLLSNFYYFFMIILGIMFYVGYWLIIDKKQTLLLIKKNITSIFLSVVSTIFFLIPWILAVFNLIKNQGLVKTPGFGGSITLSADVLSFFTPSQYNPIYNFIISKLVSKIHFLSKFHYFYQNSWERFAYPGIIILGGYFLIVLLKIFKKFPFSLWDKIKSYLVISLFFAILVLGPFLKIFNRWFINLDGIALIIPLPFLVFHYLPGLSTLRAASRFTPAFIFFACIVIAYFINYLLIKLNKRKQIIILISLFLIFFFDQFYVIPTKLNQEIPAKIYSYLKNKPQGTVWEIPFTVRDGFQYMGFVHAIQPMAGHLIHGKPILGGYLARINDSVFNYYKNLKFIEYIANIIDKGNYNPLTEKPGEPVISDFPYQIEEIKKELTSLNVRYIILKRDEVYTDVVQKLIMASDYRPILKDGQYKVYEN